MRKYVQTVLQMLAWKTFFGACNYYVVHISFFPKNFYTLGLTCSVFVFEQSLNPDTEDNNSGFFVVI